MIDVYYNNSCLDTVIYLSRGEILEDIKFNTDTKKEEAMCVNVHSEVYKFKPKYDGFYYLDMSSVKIKQHILFYT